MGSQGDRLSRGEWYLDDEELQQRRRECWRQLDVFNAALADDDATRDEALRRVIGSLGLGVVVVPRFQCSYGDNILNRPGVSGDFLV